MALANPPADTDALIELVQNFGTTSPEYKDAFRFVVIPKIYNSCEEIAVEGLKEKSMSAETIARLNDQLRYEVTTLGGSSLGTLTMSAGVAGLPPDVLFLVVKAVREYTDFTPGPEGNDPYGEHDFGTIELDGVGKFYWKIGYYDKDEKYGSEAPEDPEMTTRIMTVMMVEEWLRNTKWPD